MKSKKINKIGILAIDSPASSGAGTIAKKLAKHYKLLYCDTGKIYRFLAFKLMNKKNIKNRIKYLKKISKRISLNKLKSKKLLNDEVAVVASQIAKDFKIRKLVLKFQRKLAYSPPKKYRGSILDGRDITSVVVPNANIKFYITANQKIRAKRRLKELKNLGKKVSFNEVLKKMKKRDRDDRTRKHNKLKKTRDSYLINTTDLTIRESFLKAKKIVDREIK